jgi:hypothetical protein
MRYAIGVLLLGLAVWMRYTMHSYDHPRGCPTHWYWTAEEHEDMRTQYVSSDLTVLSCVLLWPLCKRLVPASD